MGRGSEPGEQTAALFGAKTIAAFLNSAGGTLVIGVEDDGHVLGLEQDLQTMRGSKDRLEQALTSLVCDRIGAEYASFIKNRFEEIDGQTICVVDVEKAPVPAYMDGPRGKEFFTRLGIHDAHARSRGNGALRADELGVVVDGWWLA